MTMTVAETRPALVATFSDPDALPAIPSEGAFEETDSEFLIAGDLQRIGEALVNRYGDEELRDCADAKIVYLWKRQGGEKNGKATLGQCQKLSGLAAHAWLIAEGESVHYAIWLAADNLRELIGLRTWMLEPLVHHELRHIAVEIAKNGELKRKVRGHDFEGFNDELKRYGAWRGDLRRMSSQVRQMPLSGLEGATEQMQAMRDAAAETGVELSFSVEMER